MPKIYAFTCGSLKTQTEYMLKDTRAGSPFRVPVPFFLIKHGEDWVAFDTGINVKAMDDPIGHLGEQRAGAFTPQMEAKDEFKVQIRKLGLEPKDLKALILSHSHFDHAGSVGNFAGTNVPIFMQEAEYAEVKKVADSGKSGICMIGDFGCFNELTFEVIDGVYDLFYDRSIILFPTPGHTLGHQSLYVKTDDGNAFILPADALYTRENMEKMIPYSTCAELSLLMQGFSIFRLMSMIGIEVAPSHDPDYWAAMRLAPEEFKKIE